MWFWWFMFGYDLLIPLLMILCGRIMWKHPPKNINSLIGYRTRRSMQNMDTWVFAHNYSGKLWWKIGWIILLPSIIVHIPVYGASDNVIGIFSIILLTIQTAIIIGAIFATEKALKAFTDEEMPR
ncbi:SdpI family protein [Anaerolentibacter hominis]|uniref:SdpI family protein n=1 Tax=Anaerolentibacter hominis TaxID=3079009 RepID=UPI0031B83AAC